MKPIRVFYSSLTKRFYGTAAYRTHFVDKVEHIEITGAKHDVTQDIARAIVEHGITFKPGRKRATRKRS